MDNSVMLDYLAVTIKGLAPDDVIEKILILPKDKFVLNEWGINIRWKTEIKLAC